MDINIDVENLTLGQLEFLEEFSKLSVEEILKYAQGETGMVTPFRLTMALIAIGAHPADPWEGLKKARQYKLKDVVIGE